MRTVEQSFGEFFLTTEKNKMDLVAIYDFLLHHSGWRDDMPFEKLKTSVEHSINFGLFHGGRQIGFARVISDCAVFAYLDDFYILDGYRGQGLSKKLMDFVLAHPDLQNLNRWVLLTDNAHGLYEKYGFKTLPDPQLYMELYNPNNWKEAGSSAVSSSL